MKINNGPTITELSAALAKVPDDVLFARLRAMGFVVGDAGGDLDVDQMEAAENHEAWWSNR